MTTLGPDGIKACAAAWSSFLDLLSAGALVSDACAEFGIPRHAFFAYMIADPERRKQWLDARRASASALEEKAVQAAFDPKMDPKRARNIINVLQWAARTRDPDQYAERSRLDVNHKLLDFRPILAAAEARLAASSVAPRVIEGVGVRVPENSEGEGVGGAPQERAGKPARDGLEPL